MFVQKSTKLNIEFCCYTQLAKMNINRKTSIIRENYQLNHTQCTDEESNKIVEDKEINAQDIPLLFALMQELFLLYDELRMKVNAFDVGQTLKVIVQVLILYRLKESDALTKEQKDGLVSSMDTLLQISTEMIELKDTAKKARSWFNWILKFACGKGNQGSP